MAKEATGLDIHLPVSISSSHFKQLAWFETVLVRNSKYLASSKALWTKRFFSTIFQQLKWKTFFTGYTLSQIKTGHGKFKSYLYKFKLTDNDICSCVQDVETEKYVLLQCKLFLRKRDKFRKK